MTLTEQEASTKRCQESYAPPVSAHPATTSTADTTFSHSYSMGGLGSGFATVGAPAFCIGSQCMAWRWAGYREKSGEVYFDPQFNATGEPDAPRVGYCGKAGKP